MGMTIDEVIKLMIRGCKYDYDGSAEEFCEAYDMSIEIMRKYKKIEQIANDKNINGDLLRMSAIRWVLEHGDDD